MIELRAEVVVIGGGIVGSAAALFLAGRLGAGRVVVVERAPGPTQASVRNAGGVRAQCRNRTERRLALASIELWRRLATEADVDIEHRQSGNLRLALSEGTLAALDAERRDEADDGLVTEVWDRSELRRRAPWLDERFVGAKHCASDGHANPILGTWLVVEAAKKAGARYIGGAEVTHIDVDAGQVTRVRAVVDRDPLVVRAPVVVHAAGPWTPALATTVGVDLPVIPARNAMFVTEPAPPLFGPFVSSHELQVYVRQARKGHVHVGGVFTVDGTFDQQVTPGELERLARACAVVPALSGMRVLRTWAGTLDMTPDHLPVVGCPRALDGYVVAAGFSGHGFCLGPAIGRTIAELAVGDQPSLDIAPLHPDRFLLASA